MSRQGHANAELLAQLTQRTPKSQPIEGQTDKLSRHKSSSLATPTKSKTPANKKSGLFKEYASKPDHETLDDVENETRSLKKEKKDLADTIAMMEKDREFLLTWAEVYQRRNEYGFASEDVAGIEEAMKMLAKRTVDP